MTQLQTRLRNDQPIKVMFNTDAKVSDYSHAVFGNGMLLNNDTYRDKVE